MKVETSRLIIVVIRYSISWANDYYTCVYLQSTDIYKLILINCRWYLSYHNNSWNIKCRIIPHSSGGSTALLSKVSKVLGVVDLTSHGDTLLSRFGVDSLMAVELSALLTRDAGAIFTPDQIRELSFNNLYKLCTCGQWSVLVSVFEWWIINFCFLTTSKILIYLENN